MNQHRVKAFAIFGKMKSSMTALLPIKDKSEGATYLKIAPFRKEVRKTATHKHNNYFEIIYLSAGRGFHLIDHHKIEIKPPVIFFIRREQVHGFELAADCEPAGFVLIVKKPFIEKSLDGELKLLFAKASNYSCLYLEETGTIQSLFELLAKENKTNNPITSPVIDSLLKALLGKVLEVAKPMNNVSPALKAGLFQSYLELLSMDKPVKNKVAFYAGLLNTTPQNLNAACRKATNQSAADVLADFIISEAKRLLIYTASTISEISFALDFNDSSHFIKFFKRFTGVTPQSFRLIP